MTADRSLTRDDLEAVIRRAVEIERELGASTSELSEGDLLRIAGEVGLSEESVRHALAEHYADAAGAGLLSDRGWVSRLCGPALVSARRRVPHAADEVREKLETHFRSHESLRLVRRLASGSLWEPEPGVLAVFVRSVDLSGRGYALAKKARAVELRIVPLGDDRSQVVLTADLGKERLGWFWGLGAGAGGAITALAAIFIAGYPGVPDLAALASTPILAGAIGAARLAYLRSLERMQLVLDGTLDRLEHGEPLEPGRPSWRDMLR